MTAKHKPKRAGGGGAQYQASEPALAVRGRGLCLRDNKFNLRRLYRNCRRMKMLLRKSALSILL